MRLDLANVQSLVDRALYQFRTETLWIKKFAGLENKKVYKDVYGKVTKVPDALGHKLSTFDDLVSTVGRSIPKAYAEKIDGVSTRKQFDAAFLWSRNELVRKFPTVGENEWLDDRDRVVFRDNEYSLIEFHFSGIVGEQCSLVIGLGKTLVGETVSSP